MMDWATFFRPGTRAFALPDWRRPRLILPAGALSERWEASALYPAFRRPAEAYRLALRLRAVAGLVPTRVARPARCIVQEFADDVLPGATARAVLIGRPSPIQKIVVQLSDPTGQVAGYLKCAETPTARRRLQQEYRMLLDLAPGVSPRPLKYGAAGDVDALLLAPLSGRVLRASLPPPAELSRFLGALTGEDTYEYEIDAHPWVRGLGARAPECSHHLETLASRPWPVVVQHGDLAPWNLLADADGRLTAVDWEHGTRDGFPLLDRAQYILQVAALIYRWSPALGFDYAVQQLQRLEGCALSVAQARAVVGLAAHDAFSKTSDDGFPPEDWLQRWRFAVTRCAA